MPTFKHRSIRRAKFGRFEFDEFLLSVEEKDLEEFLTLMADQPLMYQREIVQVNEAALAALERPLSQTIRGASQSSSFPAAVLKGVDTDALQQQGDADRAERLKLAAENDKLREELAAMKLASEPKLPPELVDDTPVPPAGEVKAVTLETGKLNFKAPGGNGNAAGSKTPVSPSTQTPAAPTKPATA